MNTSNHLASIKWGHDVLTKTHDYSTKENESHLSQVVDIVRKSIQVDPNLKNDANLQAVVHDAFVYTSWLFAKNNKAALKATAICADLLGIASESDKKLLELTTCRFPSGKALQISPFCKELLSDESEYFKTLFSGGFKEADQTEMNFDGISKEEFLNLVKVLGEKPATTRLEGMEVEAILRFVELADRFQLTSLFDSLDRVLAAKIQSNVLNQSSAEALLGHLKDLPFHRTKNLEDQFFIRLIIRMPKTASLLSEDVKSSILSADLSPFASIDHITLGRVVKICPNLINLTLSNPHLSTLKAVAKLHQLETLNISGCKAIDDEELVHLAKLHQLKSVNLSNLPKITGEGLRHLIQAQELDLANCYSLEDAEFIHFADFENLRKLNLSDCEELSGSGFANFKGLVNLETLIVQRCKEITDEALAFLSGLVGLRIVNMSECSDITDAGVVHLAKLLNLTEVDLSWCTEIRGSAFAKFKDLEKLHTLSLNRCNQLNDEGLSHISQISALQNLDISYCNKLTAQAATLLRRFKHLKTLVTKGCKALALPSQQT